MLRLLLVFLILRCAAASSEDGSGDELDDEDFEDVMIPETRPGENTALDMSKGGEESAADGTMVIIIVAAGVVALAIVVVAGIFIFRRYLRNREQGVYSMPAEQVQKAAV